MDFAYQRGGNLGSLTKSGKLKGIAKYKTVGDLWGHQGLSQYEDAFEGGMRDNFNAAVGRTCHLCNGEGCPGCSNTGVMAWKVYVGIFWAATDRLDFSCLILAFFLFDCFRLTCYEVLRDQKLSKRIIFRFLCFPIKIQEDTALECCSTPWQSSCLRDQNFKNIPKFPTTISTGSGGEIYTVFDEESESEVENLETLHADLEINEKTSKMLTAPTPPY